MTGEWADAAVALCRRDIVLANLKQDCWAPSGPSQTDVRSGEGEDVSSHVLLGRAQKFRPR